MKSNTGLWPTTEWEMPSRSRLFSVRPMALDTVMREALHSLIIRIARAHTVRPMILVKDEILPGCAIRYDKDSANFAKTYLKTMNGLGKYASEFTASLERLTMQSRLEECSFICWDGLLDYHSNGLLHAHPRWCPMCFCEWRAAGVEPYFPLAWQVAPLRHCPIHNARLHDHCPSCEKAQPFVPRHSYLDHCSYCGHFLGQLIANSETPSPDASISATEQHAMLAVSEMICDGPSIRHLLNVEHFWTRVQQAADKYYEGKIKTMERAIGFSESSLRGWKAGRHKPSFAAMFKLTRGLGVTPVSFLTHGISDSFIPSQPPKRPSRKYATKLTTSQTDALKRALDEIIRSGYSELPMRDVSKRLGYRHSFLIYWYRDECRQISQLHRKWVAKQAEERGSADRMRASDIVRQMYASHAHVTRRSIDEAIHRAGMSLQDPVVRAAVYSVREECLASRVEKYIPVAKRESGV
jgi:hypothetical protein